MGRKPPIYPTPGGVGPPDHRDGRKERPRRRRGTIETGPRASPRGTRKRKRRAAPPMADPSLLAAELEEEEEEEEGEGLRRLLLQVTRGHGEPPPAPPPRSVTPQPGLCVKTRGGPGGPRFSSTSVTRGRCPPPLVPPSLRRLLQDETPPGPPLPHPGGGFRIPMSLGEPHAELDRGGRGCTAYDVVVNSGFFRRLQSDPLYLELFLTVALEGLAEKYGVELELTGWRVLRNRKFLGSLSSQNIRPSPPRIQELQGPPQEPLPPPNPPGPPRYVVVAQPSAQDPRVLQARVLLPHVRGAGSLSVGLSPERFSR